MERHILVAWAAGFFDGEGSVIITGRYRRRTTPTVRMDVSQKVREPLDRLQLLFGGSIAKVKAATLTHAEMFKWSARGKHCGEVLKELQPYLIVKHAQVTIALEFLTGVGGQGNNGRAFLSSDEEERREGLREAMLIVNQTGPR